MAARGADAHARAANRQRYGDGEDVRRYLADPYHRTRRAIAVRLLVEALPGPGAGGSAAPILEIGTGSRGMLDGAADLPYPVVEADLAVDALRGAGTAVCFDAACSVPLRTGSLAAVVMGELIEHVYDPVRLLAECHRALRPGGVLVLTTPNLANVQDRLRFLLGHAPRHVDPLHPYLRLHIRPFTLSLLDRTLRAAHFRPISARSNYVVWRLSSGRWWKSRLLARFAPGLGGSLVLSARRIP